MNDLTEDRVQTPVPVTSVPLAVLARNGWGPEVLLFGARIEGTTLKAEGSVTLREIPFGSVLEVRSEGFKPHGFSVSVPHLTPTVFSQDVTQPVSFNVIVEGDVTHE